MILSVISGMAYFRKYLTHLSVKAVLCSLPSASFSLPISLAQYPLVYSWPRSRAALICATVAVAILGPPMSHGPWGRRQGFAPCWEMVSKGCSQSWWRNGTHVSGGDCRRSPWCCRWTYVSAVLWFPGWQRRCHRLRRLSANAVVTVIGRPDRVGCWWSPCGIMSLPALSWRRWCSRCSPLRWRIRHPW